MTGFGRAETHYGNFKITIEIKSLNSRSNELRVKIPFQYSEKELWVRNQVMKELDRGKIDIIITNDHFDSQNMSLNNNLFREYYNQLNNLADELEENNRDFFPAIIRIPNIFKETVTGINDEEWEMTEKCFMEALRKLISYRVIEGKSIEADISTSLNEIISKFESIEQSDIQRKNFLRQRMDNMINEISNNNKVDKDRFEQEVMFYLEKLDINEEKSRLRQHCTYMEEVMKDKSTNIKGKKLSFICQEIGREINTMGAKAQYSNLQKIVVEMKDSLEKIKEQLNNVL